MTKKKGGCEQQVQTGERGGQRKWRRSHFREMGLGNGRTTVNQGDWKKKWRAETKGWIIVAERKTREESTREKTDLLEKKKKKGGRLTKRGGSNWAESQVWGNQRAAVAFGRNQWKGRKLVGWGGGRDKENWKRTINCPCLEK